jgi:hypothetical protein
MPAVANPYVNLDLKIPSQYSEDFKKYTSRFKSEDGSIKDIDRVPSATVKNLRGGAGAWGAEGGAQGQHQNAARTSCSR